MNADYLIGRTNIGESYPSRVRGRGALQDPLDSIGSTIGWKHPAANQVAPRSLARLLLCRRVAIKFTENRIDRQKLLVVFRTLVVFLSLVPKHRNHGLREFSIDAYPGQCSRAVRVSCGKRPQLADACRDCGVKLLTSLFRRCKATSSCTSSTVAPLAPTSRAWFSWVCPTASP